MELSEIEKFTIATLKTMERKDLSHDEQLSIAVSILGSILVRNLYEISNSGYKERYAMAVRKAFQARLAVDAMFARTTKDLAGLDITTKEGEV